MSNTSNTTISNQELDKLREYEFILHELQKTARIGWWKVDFNTHQITCSEYIVEILGLDRNEMSIEQFFSLVNAKHRQRISKNFQYIRTQNFYDEIFLINTRYGELWIHSKIGDRIVDKYGNVTAVGYAQVVDDDNNFHVSKEKEENRLKELMLRQYSLSRSLSYFMTTTDTRQAITNTLENLLEQFKGDRTYIFEYDEKKETQSCIYEVTRKGVQPEIDTLQNIDTNYNEWWSKQIFSDIPIIINHLDELPPEAENDKQVLARQNIASLMVVPMISAEGIWGYMGIDVVDTPRLWNDIDKEWFTAISNIINICIELRSSEKKARQEREYLQKLYEHMPVGYLRMRVLYNATGKPQDYIYLDSNPEFHKITGKGANHFAGKTARELQPESLHIVEKLHHISISKSVSEANYVMEDTGRQYHVILYSQGNEEIVALFMDITERMKAMEALRRSEETLRNIFKNIPVGIEIYDKDGYLTEINDIEAEMFGFSRKEDVLGVNLFENPNLPPQSLEELRQGNDVMFPLIYKFSKIDKIYYNTKHSGSKNLTVKGTCLYDEKHQITNYLLIVIDNTEAFKAYRKIEEFETLFNDIAEFSKVGICRWNPLQNNFFGSDVWFHNLNQESHPIHNIIDAHEHVHPDDLAKLTSFFRDVIDGEAQELADEIRVQFGKNWRWMRVRFKVKEYNPLNRAIELIGLNIDITESKEIEEKLIKAKQKAEESDRLKSAFLANMSHEIRTPLNAIVGFSNLLADTNELAEREQYISVIQKNNELLLQLISDILDLSKIEAGTFSISLTNVDVNALCEEVVCLHTMKLSPDVTLSFEKHEPVCFIYSDGNRLTQVLSNFVNNAIKFTEKGSIRLGYHVEENHIKFYVKDTGIGIPRENIEMIFERFMKLNTFANGTGLGLPICKSIIEKLNGTIGADSVPGLGSTFWFTLPYNSHAPGKTIDNILTDKAASPWANSGRKKILVAENKDNTYTLIAAILQNEYDLIRAFNGKEAITLHEHYNPDLILMDIHMPEMDGLEATREIRKTDSDVKIIALVDFTYDSDRQKAFEAGCNDYLSKPITPDQLKRMVNTYS